MRWRGRRIESEFPGRQGRILFAYLAASRNRTASRDELIEAVWPRELPSAPEMALSALLSKLRKLLDEDALRGRSELRLVIPDDAWVDLETAVDAAHRAESAVIAEDWWSAYGAALIARNAARRGFLSGEEAPWIDERRTQVADLHVRALECLAAAQVAVGGTELPIGARGAAELVELAPYRETACRLLMRAHVDLGNTAEALRVYEELRCRLRDELGTTPSPETQALHEELLRQGASA